LLLIFFCSLARFADIDYLGWVFETGSFPEKKGCD
jgi:hypothetical protein